MAAFEYIYIIYTPNLGLGITVFDQEREQGRFRGSSEGARGAHPNNLTDRITGRIVDQLTHNSTFKAVGFLLSTKSMPELSMNGEKWIMITNQSCDKSA